jgi:DNA-binding response OmpR family regulator
MGAEPLPADPLLRAVTGAPRPARILLVDDDADLLVLLAEDLGNDGFQVTTARDGVEALRHLESSWPDLLITDLLIPGMDGLTLARIVKERADLPIMILSAVDLESTKAEALEEVAEDYVTKPFHYPELRARIKRVMRRVGDRPSPGKVRLGPDLTLELHRRRATVMGQPVALTPVESRLLYALSGSLGVAVSTDALVTRGWVETNEPDPSYLRAAMRRLRHKIERDPDRPVHLETVRGVGYRLNQLPEQHASDSPVSGEPQGGPGDART